MAREFEIKGPSKLKYFLGIEVTRSQEGIFVSQQKDVLDLLKETGKLACKPVDSLLSLIISSKTIMKMLVWIRETIGD